MNDWDTNQELALRITADFFKLRELRAAISDVTETAQVVMRADLSVNDYHTMIHAMELQHTIIAARLRLNIEAYRTLIEIKNGDDHAAE